MMDAIATEALRRESSHAEHPTNRNLAAGKGNLKGLRGEEAFASRYRLSVDLMPRSGGDGGKDGIIRTIFGEFPYDVKTAEIPRWLLVEMAKCKPRTIYVLCRYIPIDDRAELIGWQWGIRLMETEAKDYGRAGIISYGWPAGELRPMQCIDSIVIK